MISVATNSPVPVFSPIILIRSQTLRLPVFTPPEKLTANVSHRKFFTVMTPPVIDCTIPPIRPSLGSCHIRCPSVKSRYPRICDHI